MLILLSASRRQLSRSHELAFSIIYLTKVLGLVDNTLFIENECHMKRKKVIRRDSLIPITLRSQAFFLSRNIRRIGSKRDQSSHRICSIIVALLEKSLFRERNKRNLFSFLLCQDNRNLCPIWDHQFRSQGCHTLPMRR